MSNEMKLYTVLSYCLIPIALFFYFYQVHRIGRTGRAGAKGAALSFITGDEDPYLL